MMATRTIPAAQWKDVNLHFSFEISVCFEKSNSQMNST